MRIHIDTTSNLTAKVGSALEKVPVSTNNNNTNAPRDRLGSFASAGSTHSDDGNYDSDHSSHGSGGNQQQQRRADRSKQGKHLLAHSSSKVGLDEMIEDRRADGNLRENVVHIEVPFGKPIEEVYDGVQSGLVLGSGISGTVRLVTHKATGIKYAVKVLDLGLVDNGEGLRQLREEIFIMCQVCSTIEKCQCRGQTRVGKCVSSCIILLTNTTIIFHKLSQLDHPNIVRLEEVYESQSEIYLVQELCLGGELFDRLDEQPDYHYTEAQCARLVKQMLCAVRYLHSKGIIHRDLKVRYVSVYCKKTFYASSYLAYYLSSFSHRDVAAGKLFVFINLQG
jgi:Protein kinase domain